MKHIFWALMGLTNQEVVKIRNRRVVVGNTLNVLSRDHVNCEPPDLDVKCGENEQCGKWSCQMLRDKLTCDVTCDTGWSNPVGKKVCDCSVHHGPIKKYDEMACKWILLIPPSCNPVSQQSKQLTNPGYNQAASFQQQGDSLQQEKYFNFQQPQASDQFNNLQQQAIAFQQEQQNSLQPLYSSFQENQPTHQFDIQPMPRAYPLVQPVYRQNQRLPPLVYQQNQPTSNVQAKLATKGDSQSDSLCESVDMPCYGNGIYVHGTICKTKCPLRGEVERRKCVCRQNGCYWKIIRKCNFSNQPLLNRSVTGEQAVQLDQSVESVQSLGFNQISVLKVATGFKDQLLAAFQDLCSQKGQSCLFTFNET